MKQMYFSSLKGGILRSRMLLIFILLLVSFVASAQEGSPVYNKLKQEYNSVYWNKYDKTYSIRKGNKEGLVDKNGKVLVEANKYTYVLWSDYSKQYIVKIGDYVGVLDSNGREILSPTIYTEARYNYANKEFIVKKGDKVGVIDSAGKVIVDFVKGSSITHYKPEGCYFVFEFGDHYKLTTSVKLYTHKGKKIFSSKNPEDYKNRDYGIVSEGLITIRDGKLWGYMDVSNGKMVIPAQYTSADAFENGIAKVSKGTESFLISNPLKDGGKSNVLSSITLGDAPRSDIDENIYETSTKQENTFAVIIANQNYNDFIVPFAINDGKVVQKYFQKTLGIPESNIIYYEDATLNNIFGIVSRLKDLADVYESDMKLIFYYAGQGVSDERHRPYLMPVDASIDMISKTGYALESLYRVLGELNIESTVVLLDAGFNNEDRKGKNIGQAVKTVNVPINGDMVILSSCSSGETSFVYEDKGHGMFTYYFCKILQETKGNATIQRISDYISSSVKNSSSKIFNRQQTPQIICTDKTNVKNTKL